MFKIKLFLFVSLFSLSNFVVFSQTENWRQYSSTMTGFAVKYPSDWQVEQEEAKGQTWRITINSPGQRDDDVWEHNSITICSKPKRDSFESLDRCAAHHVGNRNNKLISEKTITLNGIEIRRVETTDVYHQNTIFLNAFFSTKDRDFQISGFFRKIFNLDRFVPVFDQLLRTFQPLNEKLTLTYKNEQYDFALTYPVSWKSCPLDYYTKKEDILILAPESTGCRQGNEITISAVPEFSNTIKIPDIGEILRKQNYSAISPNLELNQIQTISGEKSEGKYIYRQRYFSVAKSEIRNLLKISEMYDKEQEKYQQEAKKILATIRNF